MLNRDLSGFSDATLAVVFANGAKHFDEQGYDGPWVMSEDATCICPTADVRAVEVDGKKWLQLDCFSSGPIRIEHSADVAIKLAELLTSDAHKAVLGTLVMTLPAYAPRTIRPFPAFLLPGNGPNVEEADVWEAKFCEAGLRANKEVLGLGADGAVRGHWLR